MGDVVKVSHRQAADGLVTIPVSWPRDGVLLIEPGEIRHIDHRHDGLGQLQLRSGEHFVTRLDWADLKALVIGERPLP